MLVCTYDVHDNNHSPTLLSSPCATVTREVLFFPYRRYCLSSFAQTFSHPHCQSGGCQISKIHGDICEQIFKSSGRGRKQSKKSQEAKAASATVSKNMSKLEHPKGSGLLATGDLKKLVSCGSNERWSGDPGWRLRTRRQQEK